MGSKTSYKSKKSWNKKRPLSYLCNSSNNNNACILCLCFVNKQLVVKSFFHIEEIVESELETLKSYVVANIDK